MIYTIAPHVNKVVCEPPFFIKVFEMLEDKLDDTHHFIIGRINNPDEKKLTLSCIIPGKKNILIMLSDEAGIRPDIIDIHFDMIFRTYSNKKLYDDKKVFAVPCGFSCSYGNCFGKNDWIYNDMEKPKTKLVDRKYDIFYSGQMSPNRVYCVNTLNNLKNNYKAIVNVTPSFAKGYELDEYYMLMQNSKIAIVPNGAVVPESFRYFEAFESNCIVISSFPVHIDVYNNWFYHDSPAIFLKDWSQLTKELIDSLLTVENLEKYQIANRKYFDNNLSTNAIAKYILEKINK